MAKKRNTQKQESPGGGRNRAKLKIQLKVSGKECLTHLDSYKKFGKSRLHKWWILNHKQKACKETQRMEVVKIIDNFLGQIHRVISLNQVFKRKFQLKYIRQPIWEEFRYYSISTYWKVLCSEIMKSGLCLWHLIHSLL